MQWIANLTTESASTSASSSLPSSSSTSLWRSSAESIQTSLKCRKIVDLFCIFNEAYGRLISPTALKTVDSLKIMPTKPTHAHTCVTHAQSDLSTYETNFKKNIITHGSSNNNNKRHVCIKLVWRSTNFANYTTLTNVHCSPVCLCMLTVQLLCTTVQLPQPK